ncbi:MAG: hypothetical protein MAG431_01354 [Chloroflexi bacterium]|nr:hypothetical protein [Chloroflexota bacterium]
MFRRQAFSVALFAAATLLLESTFTRLLAVAQFYHFAFLVISLALLGFGASGALLSIFPKLRPESLNRMLAWLGLGFFISVGIAYAGVNWLPFDSYSIAWERRQILLFALYYLSLALPFLVSGLGIGAALAVVEDRSHLLYAANLFGSAVGALLAPLALGVAGVPGAVLLSACLGGLPALVFSRSKRKHFPRSRRKRFPPDSAHGAPLERGSNLITEKKGKFENWLRSGGILLFGLGFLAFGGLALLNGRGRAPLGITISPYKGLAHAYRYPGSETLFSKWNPISRVDVLRHAGTRRLPGLSYAYDRTPPPQHGLSVDAGPLQPITLTSPADFEAAAWMPESLAFVLNPRASVLVVEPGGGLGVLQALAGDAAQVTALVENPLIVEAATTTSLDFNVYHHPRVEVVSEPGRVFLGQEQRVYDICYFPLTDAYRPVTSGAYSLAENYTLTGEGLESALASLSPAGTLVISRWAQSPPSESLRLVATLAESLARRGVEHPEETLLAYRGIQTFTVLVKPAGWTERELGAARDFLESRRFDLVWAPDIQEGEVNRFNRLPEPSYYENVKALLTSSNREEVYAAYAYDISPPGDNHPFFFHFFTWEQTPEVLSTLGKTWQPFGGSGYFILLALLALVVVLSAVLILLPVVFQRVIIHSFPPCRAIWQIACRDTISTYMRGHDWNGKAGKGILAYFGLLGLGFLFLEIPLIQRWILLLGQPTYAFTVVVIALLFFSGLGSMAAGSWLNPRTGLGILVLAAVGYTLAMPHLTQILLAWPGWARMMGTFLGLAPLGFLMGIPFPLGLAWLKENAPGMIPWAWAVNGCASVIASVLAAIFALSYGYTLVMLLGVAAYAGAWVALPVQSSAN